MQVKATPRFIKDLGKLDAAIKRRILKETSELADDPYAGKALKGELSGLFSLRIGDYGAIYWINEKEGIVWLVDVGHRKKIYRRA